MLPEHEVHKVLRAWQGTEAGPIPDMVQQGSQDRAWGLKGSCLHCLLQQLRDIYTGLGRRWWYAHQKYYKVIDC